MLEKVCFGPFHFLFTLQHPREEEVVMFVKDFGGIISVLANTMCVIDILEAPFVSDLTPKVHRCDGHSPPHTGTQCLDTLFSVFGPSVGVCPLKNITGQWLRLHH